MKRESKAIKQSPYILLNTDHFLHAYVTLIRVRADTRDDIF